MNTRPPFRTYCSKSCCTECGHLGPPPMSLQVCMTTSYAAKSGRQFSQSSSLCDDGAVETDTSNRPVGATIKAPVTYDWCFFYALGLKIGRVLSRAKLATT